MTFRRVMLVITIVLLVLGAAVAGIVAADWPNVRRVLAISQLGDGDDTGAFFPASRSADAHNSVALRIPCRGPLRLVRHDEPAATAALPAPSAVIASPPRLAASA